MAEAARAAGFEKQCPLPFQRDEYEADFETAEAKAAYRDLLDYAKLTGSVFELNRSREDKKREKRAYEAAGLVTLAYSDILIAVWDREWAAGIGGTALVVERALSEGVPVILIEPKSMNTACLLWTGLGDLPPANVRQENLPEQDIDKHLPTVVRMLLAPPEIKKEKKEDEEEEERHEPPSFWGRLLEPPQTESNGEKLKNFLDEKERWLNFCVWYPAFGAQ